MEQLDHASGRRGVCLSHDIAVFEWFTGIQQQVLSTVDTMVAAASYRIGHTLSSGCMEVTPPDDMHLIKFNKNHGF